MFSSINTRFFNGFEEITNNIDFSTVIFELYSK